MIYRPGLVPEPHQTEERVALQDRHRRAMFLVVALLPQTENVTGLRAALHELTETTALLREEDQQWFKQLQEQS